MGSITVLYVLANVAYVCSLLVIIPSLLTLFSFLAYPEKSLKTPISQSPRPSSRTSSVSQLAQKFYRRWLQSPPLVIF